ncbi:MAG TPA: hypothetical protein VGX71_23815 [Pseudaminobacter sp.]|nr:hypothetical protein [Pseudaminobacter sp.]
MVFRGTAWPAAKVYERVDAFASVEGVYDLNPVTVARIETTGKGRPWSTTSAKGCWRQFTELNHGSDEAVVDFVRRYGDPDSVLSPARKIHTNHWLALRSILRPVARAWDQPIGHGISKVIEDRAALAELLADEIGKKFLGNENIEKILDRNGFGFGFKLLGDFMIASAFDMLHRRALMRRCIICGHWFEVKRKSAHVCSPACHAKKARGARHGID